MLARKMVLDWGMSVQLGHMVFGARQGHVFLGEEIAQRREYSEATAQEIDDAVKTILDESFQLASRTLREHQAELQRLADALLEKEEITGDQVLAIIGRDTFQTPKKASD